MKSWILSVIVMPLVFLACAEKQDSGSPAEVAVVPPPAATPLPAPPTACVDGTTYCNSNLYRGNPGFTAYPHNPYFYNMRYAWGGNFGLGSGYVGNFCNCPHGSRPVYNGQFGLGCVSTANFQAYAGGAVYWGYGANNNQWVNIPQISNSQGYKSNGCYQNVAQSCFVDQVNSCGPGLLCQTTGGGSRLGICVAQGATNTSAGSMGGYR